MWTNVQFSDVTSSNARSGTESRRLFKYRKIEDLFDFGNRFPDHDEKWVSVLSRRSSLIGNYRHSRINKPVSGYAEDN